MRFIYNRGSIIFITCGIVSLVPTTLATAMVVYARTLADSPTHPTSPIGQYIFFLTPIIIYMMGDFLFYRRVVKHQDISRQEKIQLVIGFMMAFVTMYCIYFFSLDMISELFHMLRTLS